MKKERLYDTNYMLRLSPTENKEISISRVTTMTITIMSALFRTQKYTEVVQST